jgi:hypothetical protein
VHSHTGDYYEVTWHDQPGDDGNHWALTVGDEDGSVADLGRFHTSAHAQHAAERHHAARATS